MAKRDCECAGACNKANLYPGVRCVLDDEYVPTPTDSARGAKVYDHSEGVSTQYLEVQTVLDQTTLTISDGSNRMSITLNSSSIDMLLEELQAAKERSNG